MPRKVTAAADGRYRVRYHLGIIRRTDLDVNVSNCDLQFDRPALAQLRTPQMAAGLVLATLETADTLGASRSVFLPNYVEQAKVRRACCSKAIGAPFSRHNPELGIKPVPNIHLTQPDASIQVL